MFGFFLDFSCVPSPVSPDQPLRCSIHKTERVNIYCLTCGLLTCSLCKVFGAHQSCQVAPLSHICQQKKVSSSPPRWGIYIWNRDMLLIQRCFCVLGWATWSCRVSDWAQPQNPVGDQAAGGYLRQHHGVSDTFRIFTLKTTFISHCKEFELKMLNLIIHQKLKINFSLKSIV